MRWRTVGLLALIVLPSAAIVLRVHDFGLPPFEDAAMLLRYAQHLATGEGFVWNPGELPLDGATDFLFLVMVAAVSKTGLAALHSARLWAAFAHLTTLWLILRVRLPRSAAQWLPALLAAYLALGPAPLYLQAGFGTPVFALAGLLCFRAYLNLLPTGGGPERGELVFALYGLLAGLIRPEGVLLAGILLLTLVGARPWKLARRALSSFGLVFGLLGGSYFGWHWWTFGFPLPHAFYVNGGGLYLHSLGAAARNTLLLGFPLWPVFLWGVCTPHLRRQSLLVLVPVAGFVGVWVLLSNAMNFAMRFQYVVLPILLLGCAPILSELLRTSLASRWRRRLALGLALLALAGQVVRYHSRPRLFADGRARLGQALAGFAAQGHTMAVTEAGNLPFFSGWRAIDCGGRHDQHIAHSGALTSAYLDRNAPALIMLHDDGSDSRESRWAAMVDVLEGYAEQRGYQLIARYGRVPNNTHAYYLRGDLADFAALRDVVLRTPYAWYWDGRMAENFAGPGP